MTTGFTPSPCPPFAYIVLYLPVLKTLPLGSRYTPNPTIKTLGYIAFGELTAKPLLLSGIPKQRTLPYPPQPNNRLENRKPLKNNTCINKENIVYIVT